MKRKNLNKLMNAVNISFEKKKFKPPAATPEIFLKRGPTSQKRGAMYKTWMNQD